MARRVFVCGAGPGDLRLLSIGVTRNIGHSDRARWYPLAMRIVPRTDCHVGDVSAEPVTLRTARGFTAALPAGNHMISPWAMRVPAPALGVTR